MDEMRQFADENKIEPDEWTEPVVIFNKPRQVADDKSRPNGGAVGGRGRRVTKFKPKLTLGNTEGDDEELLPNPHSKFPPPQKPVQEVMPPV